MKLLIEIFNVCAFLVGVIILLSVAIGMACYMVKDKYFGGSDEELDSDITADSRANRYKP